MNQNSLMNDPVVNRQAAWLSRAGKATKKDLMKRIKRAIIIWSCICLALLGVVLSIIFVILHH